MSKYVFANIKIPIQINNDGTTVSLINHSIINIDTCEELPDENGNQLLMIQECIKKYMESQKKLEEPLHNTITMSEEESLHNTITIPEEEPSIETPDIEAPESFSKKTGKNTTFRNYKRNNAHRFTARRR